MIVASGVPPDGSSVSLPGPQLVRTEKVISGTFYGSARPALDMPMILRLHAQGRLPLEKLIGRRYRLAEVNEAFADLRSGASGRAVLKPWAEETGTAGEPDDHR
jgi:Zn-dependent alcohol dehydrogenase